MEIVLDTDMVKKEKGELPVIIKQEAIDQLAENDNLLNLIGEYVINL